MVRVCGQWAACPFSGQGGGSQPQWLTRAVLLSSVCWSRTGWGCVWSSVLPRCTAALAHTAQYLVSLDPVTSAFT